MLGTSENTPIQTRLNGAYLLPLVRADVVFIDGVQSERDTEEKDGQEAA